MITTSNFRLIIKKETLYVNSSDNVIGAIFFSWAKFYFPENDWSDFVVAILATLTKVLGDLIHRQATKVEASFMEGCFKVKLELGSNEKCKINFIEGEKQFGDKEIIHKSITIPLSTVIDEVTNACEIIIRMRESKELEFDLDYEELLEAYHSLIGTQSH